jgi:histone acetyltransferase (RNA polymerase elongator complex component)
MKHSNIALFIPHLGCPHQCSFCNQNMISGADSAPTVEKAAQTISFALESGSIEPQQTEIAFFGGSFTAIDRDYMISLLQTAYDFVNRYHLKGIRVSTRPDAIDEEILSLLKAYGVTAIELGAQSMDDTVLKMNHRGHTAEQVKTASNLIHKFEMELGLQMMIGLYGSDAQKDYQTALLLSELHPDTVRIYPTVILKGTMLARWYQQGCYQPMSLEEAVKVTAQIMELFLKRNIRIIKVGLHASQQVESDMIGGLYHPAFRELCENEIFYQNVMKLIGDRKNQSLIIEVSPRCVSKMVGQHRKNVIRLERQTGCIVSVVGNNDLSEYQMRLSDQ